MIGKTKGLNSFHLHIFGNGIDAVRPSVGNPVSAAGMDDVHRKDGVSDFCIFDCGGIFSYIQCSEIHRRMFLFAVVSEIPFNLIYGSSVFYPFHQNVLWTFLIGLLLHSGM